MIHYDTLLKSFKIYLGVAFKYVRRWIVADLSTKSCDSRWTVLPRAISECLERQRIELQRVLSTWALAVWRSRAPFGALHMNVGFNDDVHAKNLMKLMKHVEWCWTILNDVEWFAKERPFLHSLSAWAGTEAIGLQSLTSSRHTRTLEKVGSPEYELHAPKASENMAIWRVWRFLRFSKHVLHSSLGIRTFPCMGPWFCFLQRQKPRSKVRLRDQLFWSFLGKRLARSPYVSFPKKDKKDHQPSFLFLFFCDWWSDCSFSLVIMGPVEQIGTFCFTSQAIPDAAKMGDVSRDGSVFGSAGSLRLERHRKDMEDIQHILHPKVQI